MKQLLIALRRAFGFTPEEEIAEGFNPPVTPIHKTPQGKLWAIIAEGKCPDCLGTRGFHEGSSGGMSTNIFCTGCGAGFNVTPFLKIAERIF